MLFHRMYKDLYDLSICTMVGNSYRINPDIHPFPKTIFIERRCRILGEATVTRLRNGSSHVHRFCFETRVPVTGSPKLSELVQCSDGRALTVRAQVTGRSDRHGGLSYGSRLLSWPQRSLIDNLHFSYERADVLGVFSVTMLVQLGGLFVVKEGLEQIIESYEVNVDMWMLVVPTVAYAVQLFVIYRAPSCSMSHVINASSSNWIQEHVADLSHTLCAVIPGLSTLLLPRFHPVALLASSGWLVCIANYCLLANDQFKQSDAVLCLLLASMLIGTMYPLAVYTGRILLQACPSHVLPELEKCLREVSTMEGVLEVADDHFWQLSFEKMAGTVVLRVRRDADEQLILARTVDKLHPYVAELTVQINKDVAGWRPQLH